MRLLLFPVRLLIMVLTRCSLPDSKVFCTTNPDSPYHWLYTDYITNKNLLDSSYVKTWKFLIEDNPHLSKEYIDQMKQVNSKSSAHYRRNILGEWAMAEGRVYEYFNEDNIITFDEVPDSVDRLDIGCDYGVSAPNCFLVVATVFNETGNYYYVLDEVYYDPEVKGYSQTDSERIKDVLSLRDKWDFPEDDGVLYLPHDATSLKEEANKHYNELKMVVEPFKPGYLRMYQCYTGFNF